MLDIIGGCSQPNKLDYYQVLIGLIHMGDEQDCLL